ncbi:MAG: peroxide stress protein YaaA [Clostridiaceae bacterium]
MIAITSPSKTMKEEKIKIRTTKPRLLEDSLILQNEMKRYSVKDLEKLMGISEDLALLNYKRFQEIENAKEYPSLYLFKGDVFRGINAETLAPTEVEYLNKHLRILSGLYGVLRPLDRIKPYRLEMGIRHKNERGKSLYDFWGTKVKYLLEKDAKDNILINLASQEYSRAIRQNEINLDVYDIEFREHRNGQYPIISFFAKQARGEMARFMAVNSVQQIDELKGFDYSGYGFNESLSKDKLLVFTRG